MSRQSFLHGPLDGQGAYRGVHYFDLGAPSRSMFRGLGWSGILRLPTITSDLRAAKDKVKANALTMPLLRDMRRNLPTLSACALS
jgi:hypothetical protein